LTHLFAELHCQDEEIAVKQYIVVDKSEEAMFSYSILILIYKWDTTNFFNCFHCTDFLYNFTLTQHFGKCVLLYMLLLFLFWLV